jgi:hypothetical protein
MKMKMQNKRMKKKGQQQHQRQRQKKKNAKMNKQRKKSQRQQPKHAHAAKQSQDKQVNKTSCSDKHMQRGTSTLHFLEFCFYIRIYSQKEREELCCSLPRVTVRVRMRTNNRLKNTKLSYGIVNCRRQVSTHVLSVCKPMYISRTHFHVLSSSSLSFAIFHSLSSREAWRRGGAFANPRGGSVCLFFHTGPELVAYALLAVFIPTLDTLDTPEDDAKAHTTI